VLLLPLTSTTGYGALAALAASLAGSGATLATSGLSVTGTLSAALGRTSLSLPFQGARTITQPFGPTSYTAEPAYQGYSHFHTGIDFGMPAGTAVNAAAPGRVVAAGWDSTGFGNRVIIDHGNGLMTLYGHLDSLTVAAGDTVQAGQEIGLSGSTGNSSGPHLHFGVQKDGTWVDPAPYLGLPSTTYAATTAQPAPQEAGGPPVAASNLTASTPLTPSAQSRTASAAPQQDLPSIITRVAGATGVPASLIGAVVQAESSGNPQAVSPAGAKGLMQLQDSTAAQFGVTNLMDPTQNVLAGTLYLRSLLQRYAGNTQLALAAYNAGPEAVDRYGGIPPYAETQNYVARVTALQHHFAVDGGS
jgi:hypothetical protein